jgi:hypothetical protein
VSDAFSSLDPGTLKRAARAAFEGVLVVCVAAQATAIGMLLIWLPLMHRELQRAATRAELKELLPFVGGALGCVGGTFVSGWWVLGGWRGGLRALGVVLIAGAAAVGTHQSPILSERLRGVELLLAALVAAVGAAAMSGVALTVVAPRVIGRAPATPATPSAGAEDSGCSTDDAGDPAGPPPS